MSRATAVAFDSELICERIIESRTITSGYRLRPGVQKRASRAPWDRVIQVFLIAATRRIDAGSQLPPNGAGVLARPVIGSILPEVYFSQCATLYGESMFFVRMFHHEVRH